MSAKSTTILTAEVTATITSQTAPNSIGATILGAVEQDIVDSMYNKVDGIQVNGMTNLISGVANGQNIESILSLIMAASSNQNTDNVIPYLFHANKTTTQVIPTTISTGGKATLIFEDDMTAPFYDNSNLFYRDKFVANVAMTKSFAIEGLVLVQPSPSGAQWRIRIMQNNIEVATSATITASTTDAYGHAIGGAGYSFPSVVATDLTLLSGDIITAELFYVLQGGGSAITVTAGQLSNA